MRYYHCGADSVKPGCGICIQVVCKNPCVKAVVSWWRVAEGETEIEKRTVIQMYCKSSRDKKKIWSQRTELLLSIFFLRLASVKVDL